MSRSSRLAVVIVTAITVALAAVSGAAGSTVGSSAPKIRKDSGTAYFSITHNRGQTEIAAGNIYDKLLGTGAVTYELNIKAQANGSINVKSKKVVLYTGKGSLRGTATATVNFVTTNGIMTQTVTDGRLTLDKGFGSLKHQTLAARFSGTANLTQNTITFHYSGKLTKLSTS